MWHEKMKLLIHICASKRELVHQTLPVRKIASRNISTFCLFVRNISTDFRLLSVIGNMSTSWKLSDRLPFLFGKACYVFRSENALYGTGHIIGRMMIMKTALLLNTL